MNIRDGWATEYSRRSCSVQVDEVDYATWLYEAGVTERAVEIPLKVKFRIMRLLALSWSLTTEAQYWDDEGDIGSRDRIKAQLEGVEAQLTQWKSAIKEQFGDPASPDTTAPAAAAAG